MEEREQELVERLKATT